MAVSVQTFAQGLFCQDTVAPQTVLASATSTSTAIDTALVGTDYLSARFTVGTNTGTASVAAKVQVSTDSAFTTPYDVTGAAFATTTAATAPYGEVIDFQMPSVATAGASPYRYARILVTVTGGTSCVCQGVILGWNRMDSSTGYNASPPTIN